MRTILIYGDSNTWGSDSNYIRYPFDKQWPNILQRKLGNKFKVRQAGLSARVAGDFEPKGYRNGRSHFEAVYRSELPVSILIVALGTNDFKSRFNRRADQIAKDLLWYKKKAISIRKDSGQDNIKEKVIYIAPPNLEEVEDFNGAIVLRQELIELLKDTYEDILILDNLEMGADGLHFSEKAHQDVASTVYTKIMEGLK